MFIAQTSPPRAKPEHRGVHVVTIATLFVAAAALALWYWSRVCHFPSIAWNDMRLAPAIALLNGIPIYPSATEGTINTWTYGPLPALYYMPAGWASTAGDAMVLAALMNVALTVVPLACVCFAWPGTTGRASAWLPRVIAFMLCLAIWPPRHYEVIFADNLAIALGLLGNLVLVRARRAPELWLAAFAATAAVACKQIA